jgi:hypothetical protein
MFVSLEKQINKPATDRAQTAIELPNHHQAASGAKRM